MKYKGIPAEDLKVERIDRKYKLQCTKTYLKGEGYDISKVAREFNKRYQDHCRKNTLESTHTGNTYTTTRSTITVGISGRQVQC